MILLAVAVISAAAFSVYGSRAILDFEVRQEYRRYGIAGMRIMIGTLQLLGAAGILVGLLVAPLGVVASAGLTVMMLLGVSFRIRLRDPWRLMIPASTLATLNLVLVLLFLGRV